MLLFLRLILALAIGIGSAALVPREVGREPLLRARWATRLGAAEAGVAMGAGEVMPAPVFPVETETMYALLDPAEGEVLHASIRAEVFAASPRAFINQSADSPSWAVQAWTGSILQIVPHRGLPRLHDSTLVQFAPEGTATITTLDRGQSATVDLPADTTTYAVSGYGEGAAVLAVGSIRGELRIDSVSPRETWRYRFPVSDFGETLPVVYGTAFGPWDVGGPPQLLVLQGLDPQRLVLVLLREDGHIETETVARIPAQYEVRWPSRIHADGEGSVIVGLNGGYLRVSTGTDEVSIIDQPGMRSIRSVANGVLKSLLLGSPTFDGALITGVFPDAMPYGSWHFAGADVPGRDAVPRSNALLVRVSDTVIALEVFL